MTFQLLRLIAVIVGLLATSVGSAQTEEPLQCSDNEPLHLIFDNGASWDLCWSASDHHGLILSNVRYTSQTGTTLPVLKEAMLSQLSVHYDDGGDIFFDATDPGLGGASAVEQTDITCAATSQPAQRLKINGVERLCVQYGQHDNALVITPDQTYPHDFHALSTIAVIGNYTYQIRWRFFADGSLAAGIGAAGALQRSNGLTDSGYGRVLSIDPNIIWLSHRHDYYWRLDFGIGESALDDTVFELDWVPTTQSAIRQHSATPLTVESARIASPQLFRSWRINDSVSGGPGWELQPVRAGHQPQAHGMNAESADLVVTVNAGCERYAQQNAVLLPGCGDSLNQFVSGETLVDQDIVLWHRISFHHLPRNEDTPWMHVHQDDFLLRATNLADSTPFINVESESEIESGGSSGGAFNIAFFAVLCSLLLIRHDSRGILRSQSKSL